MVEGGDVGAGGGCGAGAGAAGRWGAAPPQELLERLKDYGQEGAFALWDELVPEEHDFLVRDIQVRAAPGLFGPR